MNYNIATILAVIAILFVLLTYITSAPLVPVAVILLGLAIIFGGRGDRAERARFGDPFARIAASIGGKISSPFWNTSTLLPSTTHSPAAPCSARRNASSSGPISGTLSTRSW